MQFIKFFFFFLKEDISEIIENFENFLTRYCIDNHYEIAVVYESWLQGYVPKNWKKAAVLRVKDKTTVAQNEVSIYSINLNNLQSLKRNIRDFNWDKNVEVMIQD